VKKKWETYEEVAVYLLNKFASEFGLSSVEGKQKIAGTVCEFEIDGKGCCIEGEGFIIIECRRYTKSRQNIDKIAALAFKIIDSGAAGGVIISPLGLQEGAKKIASDRNIIPVQLNENATNKQFLISFLNKVMYGARPHTISARGTNLLVKLTHVDELKD